MIALLLAATIAAQDTVLALPPRVRAMLEHFPSPRPGDVAIATQFSRDTVFVGEQVELVTVAWFPRQLRERLRHQPSIRPPGLLGLWSARTQRAPMQEATRVVGRQLYDVYVTYETIFPLAAGNVEAPPAVLSYLLPTSTSYFAPEETKSVSSATAVLVARGPPAALTAALGNGPTARGVKIAWHAPANGLQAGAPMIIELALSGQGNITLWPAPQVQWPVGTHVYVEPTDENQQSTDGVIGGSKTFRYTVVADTAGVFALPAVAYPYFDAATRTVVTVTAAPVNLAVLPRAAVLHAHGALLVTGSDDVPMATQVVHRAWPLLLLLLLAPLLVLVRRPAPRIAPRPFPGDPEEALRSALGTPVDAGPDHVVAALRRRGVSRGDAEHVHRWLLAVARRRYGPAGGEAPEPPPVLREVLGRLRGVATIVALLVVASVGRAIGQQAEATSRYDAGDYAGAARTYEARTRAVPGAEGAWRNLGSARWLAGDEVGAAAAWLQALRLAPRDPLLRSAWLGATDVPLDVRSRAPAIPLSRDELLLLALIGWIALWVAWALRWRRTSWGLALVTAAIAVVAMARWSNDGRGEGLIVTNTAVHISPSLATQSLGELAAWSAVRVRRFDRGWMLVDGSGGAGVIGAQSLAGWVPESAVAPLGPLN